MFLHQNNKLFLVRDKRWLVSHWPPASEISMLLITKFVELRVVADRSPTGRRRPHCAVALRRVAWSELDMASVNQTRPHCVNQMGKTRSKPLAARHGRGTACARHAMCESAFIVTIRAFPEPAECSVKVTSCTIRHLKRNNTALLNLTSCISTDIH